jgi:hypothetical protein
MMCFKAPKDSKLPRWYWGMKHYGMGNEASVSLCDSRPWYGHFVYRNGRNEPKPITGFRGHGMSPAKL